MFRLLTLFLFLGLMPGSVFGLRAEAFGKDGVKNSVTGGGEEVTMDTIRLKPVAVYGMTAMRSTDLVLDTADLEPFRLLGLDDLLQYGSGMAIKDYGPGQLATAGYRGGPARHTILRWNGMRINSPMHGTVDLSTIPIAGLTSVRLAGGTAASAQIGSALGGLIDLETNTPSSGQGISGEVRGGGGSFGAWQGEGQLAYQSKRWASRSLFGYAMADNDFTVRHPVIPEFRMPSSDWNRWYALQDFSGLAGSNGFWSASFSGTGTRRNIPPGLMVSNQQESQQDRMLLGAAQYRFQPGHWDLGFRIGLLDEQIFYSNQVADIASDGRANAQELGMSWSRQLAARWRWDGQLALRREQAHSTAYAHDLVFWEQRAQSSLQWSPDTHWGIRVDVLQDRYAEEWMPVQPVFRTFYKNSKTLSNGNQWFWQAGAGITRHYARPSLNDLYWFPGGNPDLQPELGWMADGDASVAFQKAGLHLQFALLPWLGKVDHWIQWAPTGSSYWEALNLASVSTKGVEYRATAENLQHDFGWHLEATYGYTHARAEDGGYLLYQPIHRSTARASVTWKQLNLGVREVVTGWRPSSADGEQWLPAISLLSLDMAWDHAIGTWNLGLRISVDNVLNTYSEAVLNRPQPGRSLRLNILLQRKTNS